MTKKYTEALELIKKENPFPAVCGRICPRNCESACMRGDIDEAIAIDEIKKFIADKDLQASTRFVPVKRYTYNKKIAIIGGGPAGLSCAYYLAIDAIAAGKEGAISIHRFVWEGQSLTLGRDRKEYHAFNKEKAIVESYDRTPRQEATHHNPDKKSYKDKRVTFTEER